VEEKNIVWNVYTGPGADFKQFLSKKANENFSFFGFFLHLDPKMATKYLG
jgi:hypothetical protein